jgi:putative phosphoesterase
MRIAVLADTHGKLPLALAEAICTADEIWHLGDFTAPSLVAALRQLGPPLVGVLGNCDADLDFPEEQLLERGGRTFRLIHIPPQCLDGADFLLHGHTHVPRDERIGATRVLNPGTVGKPNHGAPCSYAWLDLDEATGHVDWRVVRV